MSQSTFTTFFFRIVSSTLLMEFALGGGPLFHFCSNQENFTSNSPYESNLNKLTGLLYTNTPSSGFGLGTVGQSYHDQVYGLALCRGDVTSADCKSCVANAGSEIRKQCPYNKGSIIWYDHCLFKYENGDFFGQIDNTNKFYMVNVKDVNNTAVFNQKTKELLSKLSGEAYETPKLYATGEAELDGSTKLYGLVQCTRDLSSSDCKKCLDQAISVLPSWSDGKQGGRVVGGSCNFRYEIYPFVNF